MDDDSKKDPNEITSLNVEDLDVEELERRLELATVAADPWICGTYVSK